MTMRLRSETRSATLNQWRYALSTSRFGGRLYPYVYLDCKDAYLAGAWGTGSYQ